MYVGNGATTKCETSKETGSLSRKDVDGRTAGRSLEEGARKTKGWEPAGQEAGDRRLSEALGVWAVTMSGAMCGIKYVTVSVRCLQSTATPFLKFRLRFKRESGARGKGCESSECLHSCSKLAAPSTRAPACRAA